MIFQLLGLPGDFVEIGSEIVGALLRRTGDDFSVVQATSLDQLGSAVLRHRATHLIVKSPETSSSYCSAMEEAGHPFVVMIDDPRRTMLSLVETGANDPFNAIRHTSKFCVQLLRPCRSLLAVRVERNTAQADPASLVRTIAATFGLDDTAQTAHQISTDLSLQKRLATSVDMQEKVAQTWEPILTRAAEAVIGSYLQAFSGTSFQRLVIPRELFVLGDPPHAPLTDPIDVTGRARLLAFGPYIHIPSGTWDIQIVYACSEKAVGTQVSVDITTWNGHSATEITRGSFTLSVPGRNEFRARFIHTEDYLPLEFRTFLDRAAFDGLLGLGYAELQRVGGNLTNETLLPSPP